MDHTARQGLAFLAGASIAGKHAVTRVSRCEGSLDIRLRHIGIYGTLSLEAEADNNQCTYSSRATLKESKRLS